MVNKADADDSRSLLETIPVAVATIGGNRRRVQRAPEALC
jgi:hypothetical protein